MRSTTLWGHAILCAALAILYGGRAAAAQQQRAGAASDEAAYAASIARVADSAIHRLDFFPARAQLRVQLLFMSPGETAPVVFDEVARRSKDAAFGVDDAGSRFETTRVPDDLGPLHAELVEALRAARTALGRLATSSAACQLDVSSIGRCQTPFTSASSALAQAYAKYLAARARIREQIRDTQTDLPEFTLASSGRGARGERGGRGVPPMTAAGYQRR